MPIHTVTFKQPAFTQIEGYGETDRLFSTLWKKRERTPQERILAATRVTPWLVKIMPHRATVYREEITAEEKWKG